MADYPDDTMATTNCFDDTNLPLPHTIMDQTIPMVNGANSKSPDRTSPIGGMGGGQGIRAPGRTMKECEDQLGAVMKENFDLKFRIYLLHERMGITAADEDTIHKNIELKVENESLRKELIEKQELLSQAAKAIERIEEQKQLSARNQAQYQQSLEQERERADNLERELEKCRERLTDATYYEETFGVTPEKALEYKEKLHQVEEIKSSLESELKQLTASLGEERSWAQELETERDQLRNRLEAEILTKENSIFKRDRELETLNEKIKELEDQVFKKDNSLQQLRKEIIEKDKVIDEKCSLLEEKCRAYEEVATVAEKRKKQVDQLRLSVKSRDDALTDLNNKNRSLLAQFENTYVKRSCSPGSPSTFMEESQQFRKTFGLCSSTKSFNGSLDLEPIAERTKAFYEVPNSFDKRDAQDLRNEFEEKEREFKKQEEAKKKLMLQLYNAQQSAEATDQKLKKLEVDYRKAIQMIQGFVKRHEQFEDKQSKKDRRIMELEVELSRLRNENAKTNRSSINASVRRNLSNELVDGPERDHNGQQRFEEMESKINDLRDEIDAIKAEKHLLEKQIQIESEKLHDRLQDKDLKIECLQCENDSIRNELENKNEEFNKLKEVYGRVNVKEVSEDCTEVDKLREELKAKTTELDEKSQEIDRLTKELNIKTQNLQKLVNTELWSKNKEIAKLHNHMTATQYQEKTRNKSISMEGNARSQLDGLIKELNDIGIEVSFTNDVIQLNYVNSDKPIDVTTIIHYIHKLLAQKNELEKEVDCLKWLKLVCKPTDSTEIGVWDSTSEKDKQYCELLRTHLKDLVKFMKDMLKNTDPEALMNSKILSEDFIHALEEIKINEFDGGAAIDKKDRIYGAVKKSKSDNFIETKNQFSTPSDSETFSEPDRMVSLARIGLADIKQKSVTRSRSSKFVKTFSDSEDSVDYQLSPKSYKKLEEEIEEAKAMILRLTRDLDHLTLTHSQILVENTKLTNDKLRLEQEVRKAENRYEVTVRTLQDKFHKEVTDLNQINESHRARVQELEIANKELRRHVVVCEASDSAPSSSGISSIPPDVAAKQIYDDVIHEYHPYNGPQYWLPITYPTSTGRSKSSCSPDLGIESDAAVSSTRPLKDTLKITESMTNLLSDDDACNNNQRLQNSDGDSPLPVEGGLLYYSLDEVQTLKEENVALKKRLLKTRRALEDTFQHLSTSNKNKKNVEKAITKQLMVTKSILKKTRNYEDTHYEN